MTEAQRIQNLQVPVGPIDVVLDTDAYNEIDDQFALAYLLRSEKATVKALYAAPFFNERSTSPADGMEKSEAEIRKILTLAERDDLQSVVFSGSRTYMPDENTPVDSPAARDLARRAAEYTTSVICGCNWRNYQYCIRAADESGHCRSNCDGVAGWPCAALAGYDGI